MKISIVVPAYNAEKTLASCLDSLLQLDPCGCQTEIVVVNNHSSDGTQEIINRYPVSGIFEPFVNRAAARNKGFRHSTGEFVAFLDADCIAAPGWLKHLYLGFTADDIGGCGGRLFAYNPQSLMERYYHSKEIRYSAYTDTYLLLPSLFGVSCMYRRKVLEEVEGFDSFFRAHEDTDLSFRVYLRGYQIRTVPDAVVYHTYCPSFIVNARKWFEYGVSFFYLKTKYKNIYKGSLFSVETMRRALYVRYEQVKDFARALLSCRGAVSVLIPVLDVCKDTVFALGMAAGACMVGAGAIKITAETNPQAILYRYVEGNLILSEPQREYFYQLDEVGGMIWRSLKERKTTEEIVDRIVQEYDVTRQVAREDVAWYIDMLQKENIMVL